MEFLQGPFYVRKVLEHLHSVNCIKFCVFVSERYRVSYFALHPGNIRATLLRRLDLIFADIDCANGPFWPYELRSFIRVKPAPATDFQNPLRGPQIESRKNRVAARSHISALRQSPLYAGHLALELQIGQLLLLFEL